MKFNSLKLQVAGICAVGALSVGVFWYFSPRCIRSARRDYDLKAAASYENIVPVAILGDGPAGASAALYASRCELHPIVFQGPKPGGLLTETSYVENWPAVGKELGSRIMNNLREQAREHGAQFIPETITKVDFSTWPFVLENEEGVKIRALSVIIGTGAVPRVLGVKGEKEYWGKGVTTCAICDAPFYKGKEVVVVGGGDSAVEEATQLAPHVRHITILVRKDEMRASKVMQDRLKTLPNVVVQYNSAIAEIIGDGTAVKKIIVENTTTHDKRDMIVDGVFLAVGHEPRTQLFEGQLAMDDNKYLVMEGRSQRTSVAGVFAAGEVEDHVYRQAGVAAGDGIKAALDAYTFLQDIDYTKEAHQALSAHLYEPIIGKGSVKQVTTIAEYLKEIKESKVPVVLDFYARYCPSCMHMLPVFEAASAKFAQKLTFLKIDFALAPELAEKLQVAKVPATLVYKNGEIVARYHQAMSKPQMIEFLQQFIEPN